MNIFERYRRLDLIVACVALLLSVGASVVAYASINSIQRQELALVERIPYGVKSLYLMSGATCVGEISVSLAQKKSFVLSSKGSLTTSYHDQRVTGNFTFNAQFNPLGQLTESTLSVASLGLSLRLQSANVNPLTISIEANLAPDVITRSFDVSGPVLLKRASPTDFKLVYPNGSQSAGGIWQPLVEHFTGELKSNLHIRDDINAGQCRSTAGALDLTAIVKKFDTQIELLHNFFKLSPLMDGDNDTH